jgi:four helix bundle protein
MRTFNDLQVWQKAHQLVLEVYRLTRGFPPDERYGLIAQMRRASISIAANIAEGHQRKSKREFMNFLNVAHGSLDELKYYLILAHDLRYVTNGISQRCAAIAEDIGKMLNGLRLHIKKEVLDG